MQARAKTVEGGTPAWQVLVSFSTSSAVPLMPGDDNVGVALGVGNALDDDSVEVDLSILLSGFSIAA